MKLSLCLTVFSTQYRKKWNTGIRRALHQGRKSGTSSRKLILTRGFSNELNSS